MKIFEVTDSIHSLLPNFIKFACEELGLEEYPTIDVVNEVPGDAGLTFGAYHPQSNTIYLVAKGRHPKDVFRTLAHELVHYKQRQENRITPESGETGSDEENEANAQAGVVMRNYSQANPTFSESEINPVSGAGVVQPTRPIKLKPQSKVAPVNPAVKVDINKHKEQPYSQTYKSK